MCSGSSGYIEVMQHTEAETEPNSKHEPYMTSFSVISVNQNVKLSWVGTTALFTG